MSGVERDGILQREAPTMSHASVQLYSVRAALAADPARALARLAGLGFEEVEPFGVDRHASGFADALAASGLRARAGHGSLLEAEEPERVFDAARGLGLDTVIEPTAREGWTSTDGVDALAERLNGLAERAAPCGLAVGYHNHWWEFAELDGRPALERLAERLDPSVELELDAYWAAVAGADVPALAARLAGRIRHVHVKDGPPSADAAEQRPAGSGRTRLAEVLAAVPQATRVVEFDDYRGDVFDGIAASLAWIRAGEGA